MANQLNLGCGPTPTAGWRNYDNSWSVRLARRPVLRMIAEAVGFISAPQKKMTDASEQQNVLWADLTRGIPEPDNSASAIYCSHVFEHLERDALRRALADCLRVLHSGGVLRVSVPDIRYYVNQYLQDGDADKFVEEIMLSKPKPKSLRGKLRYLAVGDRHHQWMYDGPSMCKLLASVGYKDPQVMPAGETRIANPGSLDLRERERWSVYVEALKP